MIIISRDIGHPDAELVINNTLVERVEEFKHLGTVITEHLDSEVETVKTYAIVRNFFIDRSSNTRMLNFQSVKNTVDRKLTD